MTHNLKKISARVLKALLLLCLSFFVLTACASQDEEKQTEEASYEWSDFFNQVTYTNDVFQEAMTAYQELTAEYPIQEFQADVELEEENMVTEILNHFETDAEVMHSNVGEQEEQILYTFESEEKQSDESKETMKAYISLHFFGGRLIEGSVFTNQTEFKEDAFLADGQVDTLLADGAKLEQLGESKPTLVSFSQMKYDQQLHTSPGLLSQSSEGHQFLQLPIYNGGQALVKLNQQNVNLMDPVSLNNSLFTNLFNYYMQDILGVEASEEDESLTLGALIPYDEFEAGVKQVHELSLSASSDQPLTAEQVKDIMGEPRNQTDEAMDFHTQKQEGEIEILTVVFNQDGEVTSMSIQLQTPSLDFPFNNEEVEKLGRMPADTTIEEIEKIYGEAPIKELDLETKDTMYMWYSNDEEAELTAVQLTLNQDGKIIGIAIDGNQEEESETTEENAESAE